MTSRCDI